MQIGKNGNPGAHWTGKVELIEKHLEDPLHWKEPQRVFVNSMSDLLHENLSFSQIARVVRVMEDADWHTYQILTKRADRLLEFGRWWNMQTADPLPRNSWWGVSVENQQTADTRIPLLLQTPAAIRFVSYEPALGRVDFKGWLIDEAYKRALGVGAVNWIIVGGESGPGARPFDIAWARNTIAQCKVAGVACFVKQLGACITGLGLDGPPYSSPPRREGFLVHWHDVETNSFGLCDRKGGDMQDWPEDLRVREFPQ